MSNVLPGGVNCPAVARAIQSLRDRAGDPFMRSVMELSSFMVPVRVVRQCSSRRSKQRRRMGANLNLLNK